MMGDMGDNSRTNTPVTATTPSPSSSPLSTSTGDLSTRLDPHLHNGVKAERRGTDSPSFHIKMEWTEDSVHVNGCVQGGGSPSPRDTKPAELRQHSPVSFKQEQELDAPLDFSVRRRDSVSESFTDDSQVSACNSPASRLSPESVYRKQVRVPSSPQHHDSGSSHDGLQASRDDASPSPDLQSAGQARSSPGIKKGHMSPAMLASLHKIAERGAVSPGLAAMLGQNGAMMGSLGNMSTLFSDSRKLQTANGGKVQRPFKAYPKEALQMPLGYLGLPGINPFPSMDTNLLAVLPDDMLTLYKQQADYQKEREKMLVANKRGSRSPPSSTQSSSSTSTNAESSPAAPPPSTTTANHTHTSLPSTQTSSPSHSHSPPLSLSPAAVDTNASSAAPSSSAQTQVTSTSSALSPGGSRKRPRVFPDTEKDDAYWERRRKNNDAAKRSRDARRAKEDEIAIRAALLEQENLKLRVEVAALKTETARLRCLLYNNS